MPFGTVRWFDEGKGFGYILPDDGGRDIYIQVANIETPDAVLTDGQRVEFEVGMGRKGPEALHVKALS